MKGFQPDFVSLSANAAWSAESKKILVFVFDITA